MADTVYEKALLNISDRHILHLTNESDGTGEAAVVKADASALDASRFAIRAIHWCTVGMGVKLLWDATTDVLAWELPPDSQGTITFPSDGRPEPDPNEAGLTGDLLLTTVGHSANDSYSIVLDLEKVA